MAEEGKKNTSKKWEGKKRDDGKNMLKKYSQILTKKIYRMWREREGRRRKGCGV